MLGLVNGNFRFASSDLPSKEFFRIETYMQRLVVWLSMILVSLVTCSEMSTSEAPPTTVPFTVSTKIPTYTGLSFFGGLVIMILFVLVPVGMMAYRNRNSIVEFIKNR